MNILIIHNTKYQKLKYHLAIDHYDHHILYFGSKDALSDIPETFFCTKVERKADESLKDQIQLLIKKYGALDEIICTSEDDEMELAKIKDSLKIGDLKETERTSHLRDRILSKEVCAAKNIKATMIFDCAKILAHSDYRRSVFAKCDKLIVRPKYRSSHEQFSVITPYNYSTVLGQLKCCENYIAEEIPSGDIYHCEGIVHNGKVIFSNHCKYINNIYVCVSQKTAFGSVIIANSPIHDEWIQKVTSAFNIKNEVFQLTYTIQKSEPIFIDIKKEIDDIYLEIIAKKYGINIYNTEISLKINNKKNTDIPYKINKNFYAWFQIMYNNKLIQRESIEGLINSDKLISYNLANNHRFDSSKKLNSFENKIFSGIIELESSFECEVFIRNIISQLIFI